MEGVGHILWECNLSYSVWSLFLEELSVSLARCRRCTNMVEEFLLPHPFGEKGRFCGKLGVCYRLGPLMRKKQ